MSHLPVSSLLTERFIFLYWVPAKANIKLWNFLSSQCLDDWLTKVKVIEKAKRDCEFPLYFIAPTPPPIPFYIEKIKYPFPQIPILLSTAAKEDLYTYLPNTKTTVIIKTISNMTAKQAINTKIHGNSKWKNKDAS